MSNKTTTANTNGSNTNNTATLPNVKEMEVLHSAQHAVNEATKKETAEVSDVVAEVVNGGKLQGVKSSLRQRSWSDVFAAGAIAAAGSVGDMLVTNKLNSNLYGDEANRYSGLEIIGVGAASALVASTLRFGLDFIPNVNNKPTNSIVTTSLVGSGTLVASTYMRDTALSMIKGKLSVDVEELAEEA